MVISPTNWAASDFLCGFVLTDKLYFFRASFILTESTGFLYANPPHAVSPIINILHSVVHLLQMMNLHQLIIAIRGQ